MKIGWIILAVCFLGILILLAGAWSRFGDKIKAAQSVTCLEEGLYFLEYQGDYGFDAFLEKGGAASEEEMASHITEFLSGGFVRGNREPVSRDFGCSTLTAGHLMGRNFDWEGGPGSAVIVHTRPKNGYESYATNFLNFMGFGDNWRPEGFANRYMALAAIYVPLDGMNEKGLCIADLVNGDSEQTHQRTDKPDLTTSTAIRLLLDRAATVDEAIELLTRYDMNSAIGMSHHIAISDATGRSVVVEYIGGRMIVTETPVVTNHYLSPGEKYGVGNPESLIRFERLTEKRGSIAGAADMRQAMEAVSYDGITRWSIVYNRKENTLDFCWDRNFDHPYTFSFGK